MKNKNDLIPLKSIQWQAVLEGPFLSYQSIQKYENTTDNTIEINYSFPLPYGKSVITKFSAEINGVKREAKALPKRDAEEKYEEAMAAGDSPIMLEIVDKDFCTASLGNLKKGEKAEIVVEFLQLVEFNNKRARIKIPTVLDQRYAANEDERPGSYYGVEPNLYADYPCTGELLIKKPFDMATVSSPTHSIKVARSSDSLRVEVSKGKANRDFVFDVEVQSFGTLCVARDGDQWACLASFIPQLRTEEASLDLSILLDCSGSMNGTRIQWAKDALTKIVAGFGRQDKVSLNCFGSTCELRKLPQDVKWVGADRRIQEILHRSWKEVIAEIDANLGGTDLGVALKDCGEAFPARSNKSAILLITDGEVWDKENVISMARKTGRRIFVLGIGLAPYDNLLTKIADETGGCYDSVYSASDIDGASERVIQRLRAPVLAYPKVEWPENALWTSKDRQTVFAADSYSSAAFLKEPIESLKLTYEIDDNEQFTKVLRVPDDYGKALVQLVANLRMVSSNNASEQEKLGVQYNLAGPKTNFLLVVERAEEDKPQDFAQLATVPQMIVGDRLDICNDCEEIPLFSRRLDARFHADAAPAAHRSLTRLYSMRSPALEDRDVSKVEDSEDEKILHHALKLIQSYTPDELLKLEQSQNKELRSLWKEFNLSRKDQKLSLADIRRHKKLIVEARSFAARVYQNNVLREDQVTKWGKQFSEKSEKALFDKVKKLNVNPRKLLVAVAITFLGEGFTIYHFAAYCMVMYSLLKAEGKVKSS